MKVEVEKSVLFCLSRHQTSVKNNKLCVQQLSLLTQLTVVYLESPKKFMKVSLLSMMNPELVSWGLCTCAGKLFLNMLSV